MANCSDSTITRAACVRGKFVALIIACLILVHLHHRENWLTDVEWRLRRIRAAARFALAESARAREGT
jgi:hypothetical protein